MPKHAIAALAALSLALAGCTSLGPSPEPDRAAVTTYKGSPTLPNAVAVAESLRDNYRARVNAQRRDERWAGLSLIGMGIVAGDLAIRGVGKHDVLGLGLGATGLYTANNWANPKPERLIFIEGAAAVQCALTAVDPLTLPYLRRNDLVRVIGVMDREAASVNKQLKAFTVLDPSVARARNAVSRAMVLLPAARAALARLDQAGPQLYSVVGAIQTAVERAQENAAPDFHTLVASLMAEKILGPSPLLIEGDKKTAINKELENQLLETTETLESAVQEAQGIIDLVNAKPVSSELEKCKVDLAAAGITMKVDPAVLTVQAGTTRMALASGGVPSYSASWTSTTPPADQVTLKSEPNGIISIEAKANAAAGTYTVLVADSAKGREVLVVTIAAAAAATGATHAAAPANANAQPSCTRVPKVEAVQKALVAKGIKSVKVDGKDRAVAVDGCMGPATIEAMKQFYRSQGMPENSIEKDANALLKEIAPDLDIKE